MESPQNLKKRIKSVSNIGKITKAMELVAATKMRKSQEIALSSRPYSFAALDLLANISQLEKDLPSLFKKRQVKNTLYILIASDKGLAGSFNSSLFRKFESFNKNDKEASKEASFIAVGEKSANYLMKNSYNVVKKFTNVGDYTTTDQVHPLSNFLVEGYIEKKWDKVIVFSTHFRSALKQEPLMREILPINFENLKKSVEEIIPESGKFSELMKEEKISFVPKESKMKEYLIEPSPKSVLEILAKHLLFMQVYHLVLEANASEHSARRMAMKTASDNALELNDNLNLEYNKSRQAAITKELIEITAGSESVS